MYLCNLMTLKMESNKELELAWRCVEQTGTHLFLTGKAGTGKTTFLKQLKERSPKRMIVLAPTGVAAINAGGVTIHSFFQLPFAPYVPGMEMADFKEFRLSKEKINLIRSMDLLVIDEISMVRADLLDLIDKSMRRYRDRNKPFGGVQLLMIGDVHQLAPVAKEEERKLLEEYYDSIYFFHSKALKQTSYIAIELQHVFRQSERYFLELLNNIRNNHVDHATLNALNSRYIPDFEPPEGSDYIRLTSHNYMAKRINEQKLDEIHKPSFEYHAEYEGLFPEHAFPADQVLVLKEGAQVMFLKNDSFEPRRYYNGKIGHITRLFDDKVEVLPEGDETPIMVEYGEWTNAKYVIDKETKEIREEIEGVFRQIPLKTAWAITIHKSQGLTFERAIIDTASSFAHGQTYVALSRCKTLEGLVLNRPLTRSAIIGDENVNQFVSYAQSLTPDHEKLFQLERNFYAETLDNLFHFNQLNNRLRNIYYFLNENLYKLYPKLILKIKETNLLIEKEIISVSETFCTKCHQRIASSVQYQKDELLGSRIKDAAIYFNKKIETLITPLKDELNIEVDNKEQRSKLKELTGLFFQELERKENTLSLVIEQGFSVNEYLKCNSMASIELARKKKEKSEQSSDAAKEKKKTAESQDILHPELFEVLRRWRLEEANREGHAAFHIFTQKALIGIANNLPKTEEELLQIHGIGKKKVEKYGAMVLEIIQNIKISDS